MVAVFRTQHHCDSVSQRQSHSADITPVAPTITNHEIKVGVLQTILDQEPINYFKHLKQFLLKNNVNFIDFYQFLDFIALQKLMMTLRSKVSVVVLC